MCGKLTYTIVTVGCVCVLSSACLGSAALAQDGGLKGEYFDFGWWYEAPIVTRIDPVINFDWGDGAPAPGVNADFFDVRWTGDLTVPLTDTYTFTVQTDGRVLLRIGDKPVIGQAWAQSDSYQGAIELIAGRVYPIELVYEAGKGLASIRLLWESSTLPQEIVPAAVLQLPLRARTPSPADGATEIVQDVTLQWIAGCKATYHDIYFGDDANAVESATPASPGIYRGRQELDATSFSQDPLEWNKTYYWRVDEVNEVEPTSPWKGEVRSFTTADFLVIDDFESYTDEYGERMYETWIDGWTNGTGSLVGYLCAIESYISPVYSGSQSMPFDYNNVNPPHYSEAYHTWDVPQDWTVNGVSELSLWLRGNPVPFVERPDGSAVMSASNGWGDGRDDTYEFASKRLSGDGEIVARIDSLANAKDWVRAGVMMRESLASESYYAAVTVTGEYGVSFARSAEKPFGPGVQTNNPGPQVPHWVKLTRRGDRFTAQHSQDGVTWQDVTDADGRAVTATIPMAADIYVGLCVVGYYWRPTTAEFSGIAVSGAVTDSWHVPLDDNCIHTVNSPDRLYVALEDGAGRVRVVAHPDPGAVNVTEWTQWRIPLSRFAAGGFHAAGVNLKAIKTMYVGVGDRDNPKPDGVGMIHIDDIRVIRFGPAQLAGPAVAVYPAHEAVDTPQSLELHWLPGTEAQQHDVYFGEDAAAVADATPASTGVYQGRQALEETRISPGLLEWDKTYYWRIDEVNDGHPDSPWKGDVWSFTTADFLVIDDFESYTDEEGYQLDQWWIAGWTNTTPAPLYGGVFSERIIVHGGNQAMGLEYSDGEPRLFGEAEREWWWEGPQDWTVGEVDTLVLHVRGTVANDPMPLCVAVADKANRMAVVVHPDPLVVQAPEWIEWRIPLSAFAGVDLAKVKRLSIGVGDIINPVPGGKGVIYIDDIRVIRSASLPSSRQAVAVYPAHEAVDTSQALELHWLAGTEARQHDVYFAEDADAVGGATPASAGIYQGRQALKETRFNPGLLEWNKTYYWRIDEVNDSHPESPWKGEVRSFTTADFLVIDDFESYTDEECWRLYEWWIEGWTNVSDGLWIWLVDPLESLERTIVHGGRQAMYLTYDNRVAPWCYERERGFGAWEGLRDWTVNGVDTLVLFVRGYAGNGPAPVYVVIEDATGKTAVIVHPDLHASLATEWIEWRVPLSSVPDVNLTKVKATVIGVGDRLNRTPGGTGTIYVDDIRVVRSSADR